MKEKLKSLIAQSILSWTEEDIYAISLFVYDEDDNPCRPTVTLGYNTERQFRENISDASDEQEARWNYAFWLQNEELCFGRGDTEADVRQWIEENGLPFCEEFDYFSEADSEKFEQLEAVTEAFVKLLVEIVKELHASGLIKEKFGKDLPVLIHELEYYDKIAEQNIEANGMELVKDFADFCCFG